MWQLIDSRDVKGFTINTYVEPETYDPANDIKDEGVLDDIYEYRMEWFRVMVTANKANVELAEAHLGGCCYITHQSFIGCFDWTDMVETAITEARQVIEELKK
jgi:hypothetical protein